MSVVELRQVPLRRVLRDRSRPLAIGAVLLALSWATVVLTDARLTAGERSVFRWVNDLPGWLDRVLGPVMVLGTIGGALVVAILVGAVYRRLAPSGAVLLGAWASYVGAQIVKSLAARGRPEVFLDALHLRATSHGHGFASGHAAVAAGVAAALSPWLGRRGRVVAWTLVVLVAVARVYVGVHLPLDVIGGIGIGLVCGSLATTAVGTPAR